ncbi:MAG: zinc-binding alcohol dehydrogenase [Chloroflexi bacterium]|nr:zinc-binding alcohol dehydrogenase [Chloroflexota bacterium]
MSDSQYSVRFLDVERAELVEVEPDVQPLKPNEVIGRTVKSLVSPGTELAGYMGQWNWARFPVTPGYAAVFEVTAAGDEVKDLQPGDMAFCMGEHKSWQRVPREYLLPLPAGLSPQAAPFARLMGVTMTTLTTTTARPPAKVIVTGLGIVGHLAAKLFAASGYDVLAVDPLEARRAIALRTGISKVAPVIPFDDPEYSGRVALVVECSGHEQAAMDACKVVQKRGEVVIVAAMWKQRTNLTAFDLLNTVFNRYVTVRSGWEWELPLLPTDFRTNSIHGNITGALRWLAEDRVNVTGLAEQRSPRDAQQVYQQLLHRPEQSLSVLFDWTML